MVRSFVALMLCIGLAPTARGQSEVPLLALWEFGGWAVPTAERPLGLRFLLLEDGRALFAPDDPAMDRLIPNRYFQAHLSPEDMLHLSKALHAALPRSSDGPRQGSRTVFYLRDPATGAARKTELIGHPCLARGRVFSATAPVAGLEAVLNSAVRAAVPRAIRNACDLLTGFHHVSTQPWSSQAVPAMVLEQATP